MTFALAGYWGPEPILDTSGQPVDSASLYVYADSGRTTLATLYTDHTKGTTAANPVVADALGNYTVWANPGLYYTKAVWGSQTVTSTILVQPYPTDLDTTGVTAGSYTAPTLTVDDRGRVTSATSGACVTVPPVGQSTQAQAVTAAGQAINRDAVRFNSGVPLSQFPKFRAKLAAVIANHAPARILCVGDSTTAGVYSDSFGTTGGTTNQGGPNSFPAQLAAILNARGLSAFQSLAIPGHTGNDDSRWVLGGWGYSGAGLGWGGNGLISASGTASAVVTPGVTADTYTVYYYADAGTGAATVTATGGVAGNITSQAGGAGIYKVTVTASAASSANTVTIAWTSGTVFVAGVEWRNSATPNRVSVGNAGVGSSKATDWNASNGPGPLACIQAYAPDLTIISLGINDVANGESTATITAALSTIITTCQASGDVLLMSAVPHSGANAVDTLNAALLASSGVPSLPYVDLENRYGNWLQNNGLGYGDGTHPNALGYADIALTLATALLGV